MIHGIPVMNDTKMTKSQSSASLRRPAPGHSKTGFEGLNESRSSSELSVPSWLRLQRKVLSFESYFKEAVHETDGESFRVRKVRIFYYLEDDTVQLTEHKFENSGMPQGHFMHRHRVAKNDDEYYTWTDFTIGNTVNIYGKALYIVECDAATREYFTSEGLDVGASEPWPVDPFEDKRTEFMKLQTGADESVYRGVMMNPMKQFMEARLGKHIRESGELASFLANDRKVLRFFCVWDSSEIYGARVHFTLHYFLTDDTVEIMEDHQTNSGKDPFPKLLTRCKLPLDHTKAVVPLGSSATNNDRSGHLHWGELRIGAFINVYGRALQLLGCDEFTRQWFAERGEDQPDNIPEPEVAKPVTTIKIPPHNGIGSEEDSRQSCLYLQMKPARKDVQKLLKNDKKKLQFAAQFLNAIPSDMARRFFITIYLADDSLSVFEPAQKNSGVLGGRFLARKQYTRGSGSNSGDASGYFKPCDFYVGAEVTINNHRFKIIDVDESSLKIMEQDPSQFPMSDAQLVIGKISQRTGGSPRQRATFQELADGNGNVSLSVLKNCLRSQFADFELSDHEIVTVMRSLDPSRSGSVPVGQLLSRFFEDDSQVGRFDARLATQDAQRTAASGSALDTFKRAFTNQEGVLMQTFRMQDSDFSGVLPIATFKKALVTASNTVGFELAPADASLMLESFFPRSVTTVDYALFIQELWS